MVRLCDFFTCRYYPGFFLQVSSFDFLRLPQQEHGSLFQVIVRHLNSSADEFRVLELSVAGGCWTKTGLMVLVSGSDHRLRISSLRKTKAKL
jgi:hypothetical protein